MISQDIPQQSRYSTYSTENKAMWQAQVALFIILSRRKLSKWNSPDFRRIFITWPKRDFRWLSMWLGDIRQSEWLLIKLVHWFDSRERHRVITRWRGDASTCCIAIIINNIMGPLQLTGQSQLWNLKYGCNVFQQQSRCVVVMHLSKKVGSHPFPKLKQVLKKTPSGFKPSLLWFHVFWNDDK